MLKKRIAISFVLIFLVSTTELGQVLKFPILIGHFVEHKTNNPALSVWNFLLLHYNDSHKVDDDPTDDKLPFVSHAPILSIICIVSSSASLKIDKVKINTTHNKIHAFDENEIESRYLSAIWQPPKLC